ncbi:MAG: RNA methyltransferase [Bacteroidaceae bacterium]|nr:RNA methyltransferase [Bacteroidaceae bacterium]
MLSKAKIKLIQSLDQKKKRLEEHLFVAEGPKVVGDLLPYFTCSLIVGKSSWLTANPAIRASEIIEATSEELRKASFLKAPQEVLALFQLPTYSVHQDITSKELCLALDDIQDPGNLGTIIRVADWFGIHHIFCSRNTADAYSPKAVQASMGAIARVKTHYVDLPKHLHTIRKENPQIPLYGTFLEGTNIYHETLSSHGIIIMGNEGNGISRAVQENITHKLFIPNYPTGTPTSESLNVAIATAITCSEFRRRE